MLLDPTFWVVTGALPATSHVGSLHSHYELDPTELKPIELAEEAITPDLSDAEDRQI